MSDIMQKEMDDDLAVIRRQLLAHAERDRRKARWWRIGIAGSGVLLTAGATTAGIVIGQASQETIDYSVVCYERADLSSREAWFAVAEATDTITGTVVPRQKADAAELCELAWRGGLLGQQSRTDSENGRPVDPNTANYPVPSLGYCIRNDGVTAGFPIGAESEDDVCDRLGLRRAF